MFQVAVTPHSTNTVADPSAQATHSEEAKAPEGSGAASEEETSEACDTSSSIPFTCGNPRTTVTEGTIRLFRIKDAAQGPERSPIVCTLGVPSFMPVSEYMSFGGAALQNAGEIRFLRDNLPGRFMAVVYFDDQSQADAFLKHVNGKRYSSLSNNMCRALFVAGVDFAPKSVTPSPSEAAMDFPQPLAAAPLPPASPHSTRSGGGADVTDKSGGGAGVGAGTAGTAALPTAVELPTCPVCLERLDASASGLLTTVCAHTFHARCLAAWADDSCPVCRHCAGGEAGDTTCEACGRATHLWMCVICGHVGCGRYAAKHAVAHFEATGHAYALDMATKRVWDYVGDNYVHRLIQSKCGGKIVEVPDPEPSAEGVEPREAADGGDDGKPGLSMPEKLDAICFEYNVMLMSQLDAQREYFERQMAELKDEKEAALAQVATANAETAVAAGRCDVAEKALRASLKRQEGLQARVGALEEEVSLLTEANRYMGGNQTGWQREISKVKEELATKTKAFEAEKKEMQEQLRDLYMTLETRDRLEAAAGGAHEIAGGSMVLATSESKGKGKKSRRGKRR